MPVLGVLFIVEVLAPLDQVVDLIIKIIVLQLLQVRIIKRIIVQLFKLSGHFIVDFNVVIAVVLFSDELGILGVTIEFSQPPDLSEALFSFCEGLPLLGIKVKWLRFITGLNLDLIEGCENLVVDWAPPIVFNSLVPAFVLVTFIFVDTDVNRGLFLIFLHLLIVSGSECIYIHYGTVNENLVIDQGWE